MAGGRPPKFNNCEDMSNAPNGECEIPMNIIQGSDFSKEKELKDFIADNIKAFTQTAFDDKLVSFEIEHCVNKKFVGGKQRKGSKKIDLLIEGERKTYLVELKNPRYQCENKSAIGQLLDYGREYYINGGDNRDMVLITTKFDLDTAKTIKYYNLPIRYFYMNKKQILEYKREK